MSRRFTVALADLSSGVERRVTVSLRTAIAIMGVLLAVPVLIGIGVAWKVSADTQRLNARYRALEIEIANYRAATEALARHIESAHAPNPAQHAGPSGDEREARPSRPVSRDLPRPATEVTPLSPVPDLPQLTLVRMPVANPPTVAPFVPRPAESDLQSAAEMVQAENSIKKVIAEYVSGLESRSLATLKRVWPSLGGNQEKALKTEFANARSIRALFHDSRIDINDDTTTVTGLRSYGLETQDGQRLFATTRTTFTLRRLDGAWVIEQVVHHR